MAAFSRKGRGKNSQIIDPMAGPRGGACGLMVMIYHERPDARGVQAKHLVLIVGKEKRGRYADLFNIPGGKFDHDDGYEQVVNPSGQFELRQKHSVTLMREIREELDIQSINDDLFGLYNSHQLVNPNVILGRTSIFVTPVSSGISRKRFTPNNEISEMEFLDLKSVMRYVSGMVDVSASGHYTAPTIDGGCVAISHFLLEAVKATLTDLNRLSQAMLL